MMTTTRNLPGRNAGFTLVELVLAVALMSVLLALAYGGLRAAARATDSGQERLEESGMVRMTHQFIRRQLNQLQPLPFDLGGELQNEHVVFTGSPDRIQFVAPMPGYLGQGGPQVQTLEFAEGPRGYSLLFNHELLLAYDPTVGMLNEPILLLEDLQGGQFEFLVRDEAGELLGWTGNWEVESELPVAVRLEVVFSEDQPILWPMLATGVKVDELATTATGGAQGYSDVIRTMISGERGSRQ